ncbi:hypothetical protein [Pseudomonas sp. nanlin1]|uniref:hypothetical protein n=1 Tax=Pseudomonas sp. nanlin1 TaxID=3040605 RepID=UPI00388CF5E3
MAPLDIIKSSLGLLWKNAGRIAVLCLPLLALEMYVKNIIRSQFGVGSPWVWDALVNPVFTPFYAAVVILTFEARSRGDRLTQAEVLSIALRRWPHLAVLAVLAELLYLLRDLPFMGKEQWQQLMFQTADYVPAQLWETVEFLTFPFVLWLTIKLILSQCLVMLRGRNSLGAIRESFRMSKGEGWYILGCFLWIYIPYVLITHSIAFVAPDLYISFMQDILVAPEHGVTASMIILWSQAFIWKILLTAVSFRLFTDIAGTQTRMPYR